LLAFLAGFLYVQAFQLSILWTVSRSIWRRAFASRGGG
jgi:ABC-type uncharacterized transport system permease subunit